MDRMAAREYALAKRGAWEDMPFDEETLVIKVGNKMFILFGSGNPSTINLKCDPILAMDLRERYFAVKEGYHMNKMHWNTVLLDGTIPEPEMRRMIDHSYELVWKGLPKKIKDTL